MHKQAGVVREVAGPGRSAEVQPDTMGWAAGMAGDKNLAHMILGDHMRVVEVEAGKEPVRTGRRVDRETGVEGLTSRNLRWQEDKEAGTAAGSGMGEGKATEAVGRTGLGAGSEREPEADMDHPVPRHWQGEGIERAAVRIWSQQDRPWTWDSRYPFLRWPAYFSLPVVDERLRRHCDNSQQSDGVATGQRVRLANNSDGRRRRRIYCGSFRVGSGQA